MNWLLALLLSLFGFGDPPASSAEADARLAAESNGVSVPLDGDRGTAALPGVTAARGDNPPLVVIDAGHGGHDPGALSPLAGLQEKNVNLGIALAIRDELARSGRVRVAMTRDDDTFVELTERYAIAQRLHADLFISIHSDANGNNPDARGATIYSLSEVASDNEAALLAQRENAAGGRSTVAPSDDASVNFILIDLAQRDTMAASARFAQLLHREAAATVNFQPTWKRFAAFIVLKAPDVPAILFESGFISNREDSAYLNSPQGRHTIAEAFRRAIEAHFAARFLRE